MEAELTTAVDLCDEKGRLNPSAVGWSRRPLHRCNLAGHWPRKKRWEYWAVTSETHLFSVTLSDVDYTGLAFVYFVDFTARRMVEKTIMRPFARGCTLGETVGGDVHFQDAQLSFTLLEKRGQTLIHVTAPDFGGKPLLADLAISHPQGHESMNVVIPWSRNRFQFTSKHQCLPAAGVVTLGSETVTFPAGDSFGCLDYGRGIWPYSCTWNWASFSGKQGRHTVGVNLGGRWTDGTGLTENAVVVDGRVSKLAENLRFDYNPKAFMEPWEIRTVRSDRVRLRFEPFFERVAKTNLLVLRSEAHQMFGRFFGTFVTDDLRVIEINNLVGWAEEHRARW